jgi:hypothetical protein
MSQGANYTVIQQDGSRSTVNSTTTPLGIGATFTGTGEQNNFPDVQVSCKTDQAGTLYFDFSNDNSNWDTFPSSGFAVAAGIHEFHNAVKGSRYFRVRFSNTSGVGQTYLRLYTDYGKFRPLNAPLVNTLASDSDATVVKAVLAGQQDSGDFAYVPVTQEGHLEVALHDPILPFGAVHTESLTPIFQYDGVYGLKHEEIQTSSGTGSVGTVSGMYSVSTGATIYSQGIIQGRKRLRYRAGQGVVGRFTVLFTTPVQSSYQLAGFGHAESGIYVGYGDTNDMTDTSFGILHVTGGVREIKTLTVTTGATVAGNVTVTLNGTPFTVAVTNSSNIQRTVYEISQGTFTGWDAYPSGATVVFIRKSAGTTAGTQSFGAGATGSVASIVQTTAGVASTDTFYAQSTWNGDKLDGTGASGVTIIPTNLNIFQVNIGYLGTDVLVVKCKVPSSTGNNSTWVICHTIQFPNSRTTPIFNNPSFPFTLAAYSAGSTTNLTVRSASNAGFIEGMKVLHGNRFTYVNTLTTVGAANFQALFTVMNPRVYGGVSNQSVINLLNASGAIKHTQPCIYYLIKNGVLAGNPNFQTLASNSASLYDTAATTVTYSTGDQLLATFSLAETGEFDHHFGNGQYNAEEITLQPGEWITLAAKAVTGTPSYVTGSLNTREDQ